MINEVQPNPGGANAACPTCGALLSCLSCGNDLRAKEAELTRVLADLDRVSKERLADANALDDAQREIARLKAALEWAESFVESELLARREEFSDCDLTRNAEEVLVAIRATTGGLG